MEAMKTEKGVTGLEWGFAGLGIRGVVPIDHQGALAGSSEIGFPFGQTFLDHLKGHWGPDFAVYEMPDRERFVLIAATRKGQEIPDPRDYLAGPVGREPVIKIAPPKNPQRSVLLGPIRDYYGDLVALVVIDMDRSAIEARLMKTTRLMILVGAAGVLVSFVLTWLVAMFFIKPIKEIVNEAREIAEGKRERHLATRPGDEIGILTQALNRMLDALRERRLKIEEYARTLERRVEERTTDLITSEEKFRSLVENLPLIVYRLQNDGTTEFINPCFTEKLGYTAEEVVGDRTFWKRHICGAREEEGTILETCWGRGDMYRIERAVRSKDGRVLIFIDHAIPLTNAHGNVRWIDGTMVDITELKELQESAVRTEETRILGEISARLAHEIRNPLVTAGGFARRLRDKLPEGDPHRRIANIIVEEVSRLEQILRAILSSIRPLTLSLGPVDVAAMLRLRVAALSDRMREKEIELDATVASGIPTIVADETLLDRAFESILKHAVISMPRGTRLGLDLRTENDHILFMVRHRSDAMTDEDLEQFFFPHFIGGADADLLDLPLSRIIIHRHGGKVDVSREEKEIIVLQIELPLRPPEASGVH
jgi:PAS domain S-box-containing protein